ncbi:nucleotide exchange factor GrpE [Paenibacillus selenitireducens]|uniref:Protein GrpE n=1 Tax=Paenibacillus selenitireducens TaxID=1324314 RepID=A0A1T2XEX8_9BACL|nr:nucleotide exchange factor GrpE [Paenibacillus selenitireducens]OPA78385.1 nucleotide exchange factor GrpE [Paenibacillus selenitireducens]
MKKRENTTEERDEHMTDHHEQDTTSSHTATEAEVEVEQETVDTTELSETELEIQRLNALAEENNNRYLRTQADFDNFRRRTSKERDELAKYASLKLVEQLVPVLDNFERAILATTDNQEFESFSKGVNMIFRQLSQVLEQEGLQQMNSVGQPFNPEYHQAIMQVESDEHEEGVVVEEVQKGYLLKDKVIRPAMVKVSM